MNIHFNPISIISVLFLGGGGRQYIDSEPPAFTGLNQNVNISHSFSLYLNCEQFIYYVQKLISLSVKLKQHTHGICLIFTIILTSPLPSPHPPRFYQLSFIIIMFATTNIYFCTYKYIIYIYSVAPGILNKSKMFMLKNKIRFFWPILGTQAQEFPKENSANQVQWFNQLQLKYIYTYMSEELQISNIYFQICFCKKKYIISQRITKKN